MNVLISSAAASGSGSIAMLVAYVVLIGGVFYLTLVRPQRKEQSRLNALIESLAVGDSVLTNSGFYGVIIAIEGDTVIVEFGNNKNCRIPMQKTAIAQIEKPDSPADKKDDKK